MYIYCFPPDPDRTDDPAIAVEEQPLQSHATTTELLGVFFIKTISLNHFV